jgi:hypothetical protein
LFELPTTVTVAVAGTLVLLALVAVVVFSALTHGGGNPDVHDTAFAIIVSAQQSA